jgi:hypothetical protein
MARRTPRMLAVAAALATALVGCTQQPRPTPAPARQPVAAPAQGAAGCPLTRANGDGPPGEQPSASDHGNGLLWTVLPPGSVDREATREPDGSVSQKYPWWTVGTDGELTIQGRRLDAEGASPLRAQANSGTPATPFATVPGGRFWSSALYFPTEGCWQVTGRVGTTSLTFVVLVSGASR